MTAEELRIKNPVFEYKSFSYYQQGEDLLCSWKMQTGDLVFNPKIQIFGAKNKVPKEELDNLVFNLGLADIFSYWKATCSPTIKISAGYLNAEQISFWHDLLVKGMGQYFYENKIDFRDPHFVILKSEASSGSIQMLKQVQHDNSSILIPVGGGKDSAVTLELHKNQNKVGAFSINLAKSDKMQPSALRLMNKAKIKEQIFINRILDPKIFELKKMGYLEGHIPFSAYLLFLSVLVARLFDYQTIAFSNERSSNEGNLDYLGSEINHQYSKSFDFEDKFREYNSKYLSNLRYLSFLRPLYELQIMKLFSKMPQYFDSFRSCNRNYNVDNWCGKCAKCLAIYVGLFPFVKKEVLLKIFGHDLLSDSELLQLAKDVLGRGVGKPFECVGTFEETIVAFYLCLKKSNARPILLKFFETEILPNHPDIDSLAKKILNGWDEQNNLPGEYKTILKSAYANS